MSTRTSLVISLLIIALTGIYAAIVYPRLPELLPTHWNIEGKADGFSAKNTAMLLGFGLMGVFLILMPLLPFLSPKKFEIDTFRPTFNYIIVVLVAMGAYIEVLTLQQPLSHFDITKPLIAGIMLFLAALGNLLGKVRRNFFVGVRTPWTIASEPVWVATHRLAARLMVGAGVLGAILVVAGVPVIPVFVLFMVAALYPVLYSFLLYKKLEGKNGGNGVGIAMVLMLFVAGACAHADATPFLNTPAVKQEQNVTKDLTFKGGDGFELKGTLLLPSASGKFPTMVLLPGSGPTDRDGNQTGLKTDVLKQIAEDLAKNGIATFRYDKRAVGTTYGPLYPKPDKFNEFFSWENHVLDVQMAMRFVRGLPEVDGKRVGLLGHSEGSLFTMQVCGTPDAPAVAVLAGAPGRLLRDTVRDQIASGADKARPGQVDKAKLLKNYDDTVDALAKTGEVPATVDPMLAALFPKYAGKYLRSFSMFDPIPFAKAIKCPVLVVQGEKDVQVLADKDTGPLSAALKSRSGLTTEVVIVKGGSHCFKAGNDKDPMSAFTGPMLPDSLTAIREFVKKNL